jgi:hypothetical protein
MKKGAAQAKFCAAFFVDFRSANAEIELLLRAALAKRRRPRKEM